MSEMTALQNMNTSPSVISWKLLLKEFSKHKFYFFASFFASKVFQTFPGCNLYVELADLVLNLKSRDSIQRVLVDIQVDMHMDMHKYPYKTLTQQSSILLKIGPSD